MEMLGATSGSVGVDGDVTFDIAVNEYGIFRLSHEVNVSLKIMDITADATISENYEFTNVGTTKVERPEGLE